MISPGPPETSSALGDLFAALETGRDIASRLDERDRMETGRLVDAVRHAPVIEALLESPKDRRDIESALDVSRATSHRLTNWLAEAGLAERRDGVFHLTGKGEVYADELLRLESGLVAADRLEPLLERVCERHREFVVQPFADATVTEATPTDPYRPITRFLSLLRESQSFRGFNTTHVVPPGTPEFERRLFEGGDVEFITLPNVVDGLLARHGDRAREALERGHLELRTRETLPYGLALFDERVGIGGYDETTGAMTVFVDTDEPTARRWAETVYEAYRARSDPLVEQGEIE